MSFLDRIGGADHYVSVGLAGPSAEHGGCPLRCKCEARGRALIGPGAGETA